MEEKHAKPLMTYRSLTAFAVSALLVLIVAIAYYQHVYSRIYWSGEAFRFVSGPDCFVFREPKLVIFFDDENTEECFDHIDRGSWRSHRFVVSYLGGSYVSWHGHYNDEREFTLIKIRSDGEGDTAKIRFGGGIFASNRGCVMVISSRGTKLTLEDGREFTLYGKTPLWLRCKSNGTVIELDKLNDLPDRETVGWFYRFL